MKYYSLKNILKKDCVYNVIYGKRSNGKTYSVLQYIIERYFSTGKQGAIIRRWQIDLKQARCTEMFSSLTANGVVKRASKGKFTGIHYIGRRFYFCNYDDDTGKPIYSDNDLFCYIFALSEMEHDKSISFPDVQTILFDEFLAANHNYLFNEFTLFMNTLSTIIRNRTDVKIFMLGNTVDINSPYFSEMGLTHIKEQAQGTIDIYRYTDDRLTIAVEYCADIRSSKSNSDFYFAFDNPHLEMIKHGLWDLGLYPHKPRDFNNNDIKFIYFIEYNGNIYQCEIIVLSDFTFTYIHEKTTPIKAPEKDVIYSLDFTSKVNVFNSLEKPLYQVNRKILYYFENNLVYYQNNKVGNAITGFIKDSRRLNNGF